MALVIATLSLNEAVKVTVCDWELVVKATLVSSALKLVIVGATSSVFVIVTEVVAVALLLAASIIVTVRVSLWLPYV